MNPIVILLVLGALAVAVFGGHLPLNKEFFPTQASLSQTQQVRSVASDNSYLYPLQTPAKTKSNPVSAVSIDTFIKFGPKEKEVIGETNRVVFEFGAEVSPPETEGWISYETKLEGFDKNWVSAYSGQRTIDLPGGPKEYTFLVRAKINDVSDPTPAKRTFKLNVSPYFNKVKISALTPPDVRANPSLITLRTDLETNEKIDITGWQFEGKKGAFTIPRGIEEFNPSIRPLPLKDIVVKRGDFIYISSAANPLGEKEFNFRSNKCMGYLTGTANFPVPLNKICPRPQNERIPQSLSQYCQKYVLSLKTCEQPTYQGMEKYDLLKDEDCRSYLNSELNYGGCFTNYRRDQDFWENQWYIYLDREQKEIMDMNVDTIYLKDGNGLLVNKYSYGLYNSYGF